MKKLVILATFLFIAIYYFKPLSTHPMHMDEHEWVRRGSKFFQTYFIDHNFSKTIWNTYASKDQAKLTEFFYGAWTSLIYQQKPHQLLRSTNFGTDLVHLSEYYNQNQWWVKHADQNNPLSVLPKQNHSSFKIIVTNRILSISLALLSIYLTYLITLTLTNKNHYLGLLSSLLLAFNPIYLKQTHYAMSGSFIVFFLLLSLLALIKQKNIIILNLLSGLSFATKLNGLMAYILISINLVVLNLQSRKINILKLLKTLLLLSAITFFVFIILNPFTWPNPIRNTNAMLSNRVFFTKRFQVAYPKLALYSSSQSFKAIIRNSTTNIYFLVLFIIGFIYLIIHTKQKRKSPTITFLIWFLGTLTIMSFYILVSFKRYYLPIIPLVTIIQTLGIYYLFKLSFSLIKPSNKNHNHNKLGAK